MNSPLRRTRGLVLLAASGVVLQVGLAMLWTLSYQLSQQQAWTDLYVARFPIVQAVLAPLLHVGAAIVPEIESPRAPTELGPWFGPLTVAWAAACGIAAIGYLGAVTVMDRVRLSQRSVLGIVLAFEALFIGTTFSAPGLLSQDIFGYLIYGQIGAIHGLNPYIWPPSAFVRDPLLHWVAPIWRSLPSPYGPVWTDLNWALSQLVNSWSIVEQVLAYKALATLLHVATLGLLWYLLKRTLRSTRARLTAFTAFAWNPLVLTESVGNGHNDALVLTLLLAGLLPLVGGFRTGRVLAALALFTLSGLVKYLSAIASLFLVVATARMRPTRSARSRQLAAAVMIGALLVVVLFVPWLELPDSLDPILRQTGGNLYANAVPDLVSLTIADRVLNARGIPLALARDSVRLLMKALVDAIFVAYLLWELRQVWTASARSPRAAILALIRASARASLVIILVVSIWVQAWYFVLPLGLAVLLGARSLLARISIGYTLTALPTMYVHYYLQDAASGSIFLAYTALPLLVPAAARLWSRRRSAGAPLARAADIQPSLRRSDAA